MQPLKLPGTADVVQSPAEQSVLAGDSEPPAASTATGQAQQDAQPAPANEQQEGELEAGRQQLQQPELPGQQQQQEPTTLKLFLGHVPAEYAHRR